MPTQRTKKGVRMGKELRIVICMGAYKNGKNDYHGKVG